MEKCPIFWEDQWSIPFVINAFADQWNLSSFRCVYVFVGFLKYSMHVTLSQITFVLCQQIQIDDGLLEGWSKWTPLILSTDTNSRGDDDSRYALLWFHTVRREPGMLQRYICCYHKQNRYTWNSAIIPISLPLLNICRNAFSVSAVGQRWRIQALDGLAH